MAKVDFKKTMKALYAPASTDFAMVEVPSMQFVMVDGMGDPNISADYALAVQWVYAVSYAIKFAAKLFYGQDYVVPPLEALWWADDIADFAAGRRETWRWTVMLMVPDFVERPAFDSAIDKSKKKLGEPPASLRFDHFAEGRCVQFLHIGSYAEEAPTIKRMHEEFIPARGLVEAGRHHEIYLSDPRKVEASRLRTVVRQPVKRR